MDKLAFSDMIKDYRLRTGHSQEELGKLVGRSQSTINHWETGVNYPPRTIIPKLAKILSLTPGELENCILRDQLGSAPSAASEVAEPGQMYFGNVVGINKPTDNDFVYLPLISVKARASVTSDWLEGCQAGDLEETYPVYVPLITTKEKNVVVEIAGDSMEPRFRPGTKVLAEKVREGDIEYLSNVNIAILFRNQFLTKRIKTNTLQATGILELHSYNDDYGVVSVRAEDIRCVWKILGKVWEPD